MRVRIGLPAVANRLRESYWFLPSVMALAAILLAGGLIAVDRAIGDGWIRGIIWLYVAHPEGARKLLSAIGGSMITVAGTVFSVTIAAVVYASGQYSARLLSNFLSDRGNQVTLGTFIATFLYCMVVLRVIRSGHDSGSLFTFVPQVALLGAMALLLCSTAVLIYFIHHVPSAIHIDNVIAGIGTSLLHGNRDRFPAFIGAAAADAQEEVPDESGASITAYRAGYLALIDADALLRAASAHDLLVRVHYQPGDFVEPGRALATVHPAERCGARAARAIRASFITASRRTPAQDVRFLIDELVQIAARALSPAVNDPFTASTCLDWLSAAMAVLARADEPCPLRADEAGSLRVIAHGEDFARLMARGFGALAQYAAADGIAALRFLHALGEVALACRAPDRLAAVRLQADALMELAAGNLCGPNLRTLRARAVELQAALDEPEVEERLRQSSAWLAGTA